MYVIRRACSVTATAKPAVKPGRLFMACLLEIGCDDERRVASIERDAHALARREADV